MGGQGTPGKTSTTFNSVVQYLCSQRFLSAYLTENERLLQCWPRAGLPGNPSATTAEGAGMLSTPSSESVWCSGCRCNRSALTHEKGLLVWSFSACDFSWSNGGGGKSGAVALL